jgi:hypothetical protein
MMTLALILYGFGYVGCFGFLCRIMKLYPDDPLDCLIGLFCNLFYPLWLPLYLSYKFFNF